ncbi:restriction endonuclease subunit S [Pseudoalteromonas fuliginea]|nr:restriction endonuclease subunit S [Pseudoalteromonas fuliginea]
MSNLVPTLRFNKYTSSWSASSMCELAEVDKSTLPKSTPLDWAFNYISLSDIKNQVIKPELSLFTVENAPSRARRKLKEGDILLSTVRPNLQGFAKVGKSHKDCIASTGFAVLSPKDGVSSDFLFYYLFSPRLTYQLDSLVVGSNYPAINSSDVKELKLNFPCLKEQQKIASFLTSIDTKVNQLTEKHRLLKDYKKGIMQQVFSQKIRFKDNDGNDFPNWNEYALRDILILQSDALKMDDEATYELITVKRGFGGVKSRGHFKGKDVLVKNQFTIHKGEFVISKRQIVHGACGLVPEELDGAIVSNEYNVFRPQPTKLDIDYFNRLSTTLYMRRAFFINSDGVHIEKLLFKTQSWLKTKVQLPCLKEQQKIAQFLQSLDKKIDAVNEQIEQTKLFKKGLLQQMFV